MVVVVGDGREDVPATTDVLAVLDGLADSSGRVDYAVFDLGNVLLWAEADEGYEAMLLASSDVVLKAPVVTMALLRGEVGEECLEFALTCHVLMAERGTTLRLDGRRSVRLRRELTRMLGSRGGTALAGDVMVAQDALDLGLVEAVHEGETLRDAALESARRGLPKHLSARCIYRALRIAAKGRVMSARDGSAPSRVGAG